LEKGKNNGEAEDGFEGVKRKEEQAMMTGVVWISKQAWVELVDESGWSTQLGVNPHN
jgi:hypothetical protein